MKITWEVDDGYARGSRPQHTDIDKEDLLECETLEQAKDMIYEIVQEDFEQKITFFVKNSSLEKIEELFESRKKVVDKFEKL